MVITRPRYQRRGLNYILNMTNDQLADRLLNEPRTDEVRVLMPNGQLLPMKRLGQACLPNGKLVTTIEAYRPNVPHPIRGTKMQKI